MTHHSSALITAGAVACLLSASLPALAQTGPPETTREGGQPLPAASLAVAGRNLVFGGVPSGTVSAEPMSLSLHDVITRGLTHNLAAVVGEQKVREADGARWAAWSGLLPNVYASFVRAQEQINLEAYGFPVPAGGSPIIGPFPLSDRRIGFSQTVFSYAALESARNGNAMKSAAEFANQDLRGQVVSALTAMYLQLAATRGRIDAARAQLRTAEALYDHAVSLKQAGVAAGIETTRAQVQVENQRGRVIYYENELAKQKLQLARAIGLPLSQAFEIADRFPYRTLEHLTPEAAVNEALETRADFKSAQQLVNAALAAKQAAMGSMLPSVGVSGDVGEIGPTWGTALRTFSAVAAVSVPIFQSGRERSRLVISDASLKQEQAQLADMRAKIEFEVRAALLDVAAADQRVHVSQSAADLAALQLTQAQDRFVAGIANHIEVVQAQEAVATATDNLISSRLDHNLAKAALARALGLAESGTERFLGGQQ